MELFWQIKQTARNKFSSKIEDNLTEFSPYTHRKNTYISVYLVNHEKTFVPKMNAPYISQALTFFLSLFQLAHYNRAEAYLGPCQKSVVERFCENNWRL